MVLEENLTRRGFLAASSLIALEMVLKPTSIIAASQNREVSFHDALKNPNLRQKYLEQLFENELSPYVVRVIYDPLGTLAKEYSGKHIQNKFQAINQLEHLVTKYLERDPTLANISREELKKIIRESLPELINSPEVRKAIEQSINRSKASIDSAGAVTLLNDINDLNFGNGLKIRYLYCKQPPVRDMVAFS